MHEECCCLVWELGGSSPNAQLQVDQLESLRHELHTLADVCGCFVAEETATAGMLLGRNIHSCASQADVQDAASNEDCIVRVGQLLCRWASQVNFPVGLRIGVHTGQLITFPMATASGAVMGYYGDALSLSRRLAQDSMYDSCVNLSQACKTRLCTMERLTYSCDTTAESYYLEPWTQFVAEEFDDSFLRPTLRATTPVHKPRASGCDFALPREEEPGVTLAPGQEPDMTLAEFRDFLIEHAVDVWKFGKGQAKSIVEFYQSVVIERHACLVPVEGQLEQKVELVRIDLRVVGYEGREFQLRLSSEILRDGRARGRNQKLASKFSHSQDLDETVKSCFCTRFGLSPELQKEVMATDQSEYSYEEQKLDSRSTPGIMTTYKIHEVLIRITDPTRTALATIGLPALQPFSVLADPSRGLPQCNYSWHAVGEVSKDEDALRNLLQIHGVNVSDISEEAFAELCDEVIDSKYATLLVREDNGLERSINVLKVWIFADILSSDHVLVRRWKSEKGVRKSEQGNGDQPVNLRMPRDQTWEAAVPIALSERLGLDKHFQDTHLCIDERSYRLSEEVGYSRSYAGLRTVYCIHEVKVRVLNPASAGMEVLGLPEGNDFSTTRIKETSDGARSDQVLLTCWCWKPLTESPTGMLRLHHILKNRMVPALDESDIKRRLPTPPPPKVQSSAAESGMLLRDLMKNKVIKPDRALNAAKRIRDVNYTCRHFFEDCVASFPELSLYVVSSDGRNNMTSSGRSADDEYQRTVGALFAVYWLMRLDMDGKQSFCFGVDQDWNPLSHSSPFPIRSKESLEKRQSFLEDLEWDRLTSLFVDAGLLKYENGGLIHDVDRTLAMLVLTAIHDIMKVQYLLPIVEKGRSFCGYEPGERIQDHDVALGYVLEYWPTVLPSFECLPRSQRQSVKFTQCKMEFNMGWLVQGEAPPGALFQKFRSVILTGKANEQDIAFYFVHWLTDLAGAEPYPQEGCEKFVLKFPLRVLTAFLSSFSIVRNLSYLSETEVFEDYLEWRWRSHEEETLGPPHIGAGSIARLRIVVMAQGDSKALLRAYNELPQRDLDVLESELALTGCAEQQFSREPKHQRIGPAILVYYSPALLQKAGAVDPKGALIVLAEVFRQARFIFPSNPDQLNETVNVRIDALKELHVSAIHQRTAPAEVWVLQKSSRLDAQVYRINLMQQAKEGFSWKSSRVLFAHVPSNNRRIACVGGDRNRRRAEGNFDGDD